MTQPFPPHGQPYSPPDVGYQAVPPLDRDAEHVRILTICWYVASALAALVGCFPLIHVAVGLFFILAPPMGPNAPPPFFGWIFLVAGSVFVCLGWASAILGFFAARSMAQRRRLPLCYIAAGLYCLQVPVGALLGVFTFIVLTRQSVKSTFS